MKMKFYLPSWQQWDPTMHITHRSIYFEMFDELNKIGTGITNHKRLRYHRSGESQCFLKIYKSCYIYPSGNSSLFPESQGVLYTI